MGDVAERSGVNQDGLALECLHDVRPDRVLENDGHRPCDLELLGRHRLAVARLTDDDRSEALSKVLEVGRESENGHDLGRRSDDEGVLARNAVNSPGKSDYGVSKSAIVDVESS